jgi:two-component sensor histidine kinase/CheY-like chemotaxis protein
MMAAAGILILYIDDDPGLCRLAQKTLGRAGYVVEVATDGPSGLVRIAEGGVDAVVLDHTMPGQDGLATLEQIRRQPDPPPVIYATGNEDSRVAVAALKIGAADYVIKSAAGEFFALLQAAIDSALEAARLRRENETAQAEIRAARDRFEALAEERALLMREINHRVSNSLQLIASLLRLQSNASGAADIKDALAAAENRVMAVAQAHRRLYTSDSVQSIELDRYLQELADSLRGSTEGRETQSVLELKTEPVAIHPDRAIALGVIVTELVLNALKYAYPISGGPIRVLQRALPDHRVELAVEDDGAGVGPPPAGSTGLGQKIIHAMATKLDATLLHDPAHAGTRVVLTFAA